MMRILTALIVFTGYAAQAQVAKPLDTHKPAVGTAIIGGVNFNYGVQDRGLSMSSGISDGVRVLEKTFVLDFESSPLEMVKASVSSDLEADVAKKCAALGRIEYFNQTGHPPPDIDSDLKTEIISRSLFGGVTNSLYGVFVCSVRFESLH